ncbi:NAD-dependent malic enzyme, partial [Candidatus Nomurabacteria bacterium]|nr:NAD-dependent malic enzyme [Candidatus Nomurabacteria bacterium]
PIIFTLANPTPEIMPEEALKAGAFIVATGRSDYPNQINNSLMFPNAFRAMLDYKIPQFENKIFVTIAIALANAVKNPTKENIIPTMFDQKARKAVYKAVASLAKK